MQHRHLSRTHALEHAHTHTSRQALLYKLLGSTSYLLRSPGLSAISGGVVMEHNPQPG